MSDTPGDIEKQPPECKALGCYKMKCPNLKEMDGGFSGERYRCETCGESFYLDYEEMK